MKFFTYTLTFLIIFFMNISIADSKETKNITAFGDSLTAGYGLPINNSYPYLLEKKLNSLGYKYNVINAGLSGDTSEGGLSRISWVLKSKPDIVILELGANDAMRAISPEITKNNLSKIIETLQKSKIEILLCGMKAPRNLGKNYYEKFDSIYPNLAKKYKLKLIPFFLEGVALKKDLNIEDGIHPNIKGYQIVIDKNIFPNLKSFLIK